MGGASRMPAPRLGTHCPLTCDPIHGENSPFCRAARRPGPLERQGQVLHRHVAPARWQTYVVWWRQQTKNRSVGARPDSCCSNTAALDIAPHPAMSVPCGLSDGLPIGTMLAGNPSFATVLKVARALGVRLHAHAMPHDVRSSGSECVRARPDCSTARLPSRNSVPSVYL